VPTFSVPTARDELVHFELPDQVVIQLQRPPRAFTPLGTWPPETTNLDLIALWLLNPDSAAIPNDQFMDPWQRFEILPRESEPQFSNREWWLTSAVYQHLWIGTYAPPLDAPIPEWQADELSVLRRPYTAERLGSEISPTQPTGDRLPSQSPTSPITWPERPTYELSFI
jgi:hypothetical protein